MGIINYSRFSSRGEHPNLTYGRELLPEAVIDVASNDVIWQQVQIHCHQSIIAATYTVSDWKNKITAWQSTDTNYDLYCSWP